MKFCLIIDDRDQKDEIHLLETTSNKMQFPITCYFFHLGDRDIMREEVRNGVPDFVLDFDKILAKLESLYDAKHIDLIACDYKYDDASKDGLKLISFLKGNSFKGKKIPYLLYSSKFEEIEENLQNDVRGLIEDKDRLKEYLERYFETHPQQIIERDTYVDSIIEYLKRNKTSLSLKLESKLLEHPDQVFSNIFPRFRNKRLRELANLLRRSTEESDDFESEFLERAVAHFIHLEE